MSTPHNPTAHDAFIAMGATYYHVDEEFGDDGNGESGPMPYWYPAYDEYTLNDHYVYILADGTAEYEPGGSELDAYIAQWNPEH